MSAKPSIDAIDKREAFKAQSTSTRNYGTTSNYLPTTADTTKRTTGGLGKSWANIDQRLAGSQKHSVMSRYKPVVKTNSTTGFNTASRVSYQAIIKNLRSKFQMQKSNQLSLFKEQLGKF